jgi:hypothetical protein
METKISGLIATLASIKVQADFVLNSFEQANSALIRVKSNLPTNYQILESEVLRQRSAKILETKMILEKLKQIAPDIYDVSKKVMQNFSVPITSDQAQGALRQICIECDGLVGFLSAMLTPLSPQDADKLNKLRSEMSDVALKWAPAYERNLAEAILEQEKGHSLASALITSRVINNVLDAVKGENIEAKIKYLNGKNIIQREDEKVFIIKACKKARNVFSHDIKFFAAPSDALSLLGDCIKLLKIISPSEE